MKTKFYKVVNMITGKNQLFNFYDLAKMFVSSQDEPKEWRIIEEE